MTLEGKGFFIWKVRDCERGDPQSIASAAQSAGFTHVLIKVADANYPFNIDIKTKTDLVPPVVEALRDRGIQAWGWQFVYGFDPVGEARIAIKRIQQFNLDGFVIDAEGEYKQPGRATAAKRYMQDLRKACPKLPLALSSYRFPSYHPQLPWREFLNACDYNMPQVYWEKAHNPAAQIARCVREFNALTPARPVFPTGPTYKTGGWRPSDEDMREFFKAIQEHKLAGANFFSWDECTRDLPNLWQIIAAQPWGSFTPQPPAPPPAPPPPAPKELPERWIDALNQRSLDDLTELYHADAVHVNAARMVQGRSPIQQWYRRLLNDDLPEATFTLGANSLKGGMQRIHWQAASARGIIHDGSDTLGIKDGKIAFHYTQFTIQTTEN